jgi:hypothetical protein
MAMKQKEQEATVHFGQCIHGGNQQQSGAFNTSGVHVGHLIPPGSATLQCSQRPTEIAMLETPRSGVPATTTAAPNTTLSAIQYNTMPYSVKEEQRILDSLTTQKEHGLLMGQQNDQKNPVQREYTDPSYK